MADQTLDTKKRILLIEDDVLISSILAKHLEQDGFEVVACKSGEDGLEEINKKSPEILLLDIFLPGVQGLDFLEQLRKKEETKNIKVLVVSNTDQLADKERARSLGADFIIKASVTPKEIAEKIKEMLKIS